MREKKLGSRDWERGYITCHEVFYPGYATIDGGSSLLTAMNSHLITVKITGVPPPPPPRSYLYQGLKHLHDHRLCHLDIKPANIFLGQDGSCKLGDFGLCVSLDQGLGEATEGDANYLAPELMAGRFGKPADIFRWVILRRRFKTESFPDNF